MNDRDTERERLARKVLAASGHVPNPERYLNGLMTLSPASLSERLAQLDREKFKPYQCNRRLSFQLA